MARIGIATIFTGNNNYGGVLQAYALQHVLKKMVPESCIVEHINFEYGPSPLYPTLWSRCQQYTLRQIIAKLWERGEEGKTYLIADDIKKRLLLFDAFRNKYINQSKTYSANSHADIGRDYDVLIAGSDQIWNPNIVNDIFLFDFPTSAKLIAYAASISREELSSREKNYMIPRIAKFSYVGVREKTAKDILRANGINSDVLLDPTMLLSSEEWSSIATARIIDEPYVLVYSFSDCKLKHKIDKYYRQRGIKVFCIPYAKMLYNDFDGSSAFEKLWDVGPMDFLSLIKNASHVYTDSFHGAAFSIIFNIPFTVYDRGSSIGKVNINSRLHGLLSMFNLSSRLALNDIITSPIDFGPVNAELGMLRAESLNWLRRALTNM